MSGKKPHSKAMDSLKEELLKWLCIKHATNTLITRPILRKNAIDLVRNFDLTDSFKCSESWLTLFLKRHGFSPSLNTEEGPILEDFATWVDLIGGLINQYAMEDQYHVDELTFYTDFSSPDFPNEFPMITSTLRVRIIVPSMQQMTLLAACNAAGSSKLKPLICGVKPVQETDHFTYSQTSDAKITDEILAAWLQTLNRALFRESRSIMLFVSRKRINVLKLVNLTHILIVFYPVQLPAELKPLRRDVLHYIKMHYRQAYIETISDMNNFRWSPQDMAEKIAKAWNEVPKDLIVFRFLKTKFRKDDTMLGMNCPQFDKLRLGTSFETFVTFDDVLSEDVLPTDYDPRFLIRMKHKYCLLLPKLEVAEASSEDNTPGEAPDCDEIIGFSASSANDIPCRKETDKQPSAMMQTVTSQNEHEERLFFPNSAVPEMSAGTAIHEKGDPRNSEGEKATETAQEVDFTAVVINESVKNDDERDLLFEERPGDDSEENLAILSLKNSSGDKFQGQSANLMPGKHSETELQGNLVNSTSEKHSGIAYQNESTSSTPQECSKDKLQGDLVDSIPGEHREETFHGPTAHSIPERPKDNLQNDLVGLTPEGKLQDDFSNSTSETIPGDNFPSQIADSTSKAHVQVLNNFLQRNPTPFPSRIPDFPENLSENSPNSSKSSSEMESPPVRRLFSSEEFAELPLNSSQCPDVIDDLENSSRSQSLVIDKANTTTEEPNTSINESLEEVVDEVSSSLELTEASVPIFIEGKIGFGTAESRFFVRKQRRVHFDDANELPGEDDESSDFKSSSDISGCSFSGEEFQKMQAEAADGNFIKENDQKLHSLRAEDHNPERNDEKNSSGESIVGVPQENHEENDQVGSFKATGSHFLEEYIEKVDSEAARKDFLREIVQKTYSQASQPERADEIESKTSKSLQSSSQEVVKAPLVEVLAADVEIYVETSDKSEETSANVTGETDKTSEKSEGSTVTVIKAEIDDETDSDGLTNDESLPADSSPSQIESFHDEIGQNSSQSLMNLDKVSDFDSTSLPPTLGKRRRQANNTSLPSHLNLLSAETANISEEITRIGEKLLKHVAKMLNNPASLQNEFQEPSNAEPCEISSDSDNSDVELGKIIKRFKFTNESGTLPSYDAPGCSNYTYEPRNLPTNGKSPTADNENDEFDTKCQMCYVEAIAFTEIVHKSLSMSSELRGEMSEDESKPMDTTEHNSSQSQQEIEGNEKFSVSQDVKNDILEKKIMTSSREYLEPGEKLEQVSEISKNVKIIDFETMFDENEMVKFFVVNHCDGEKLLEKTSKSFLEIVHNLPEHLEMTRRPSTPPKTIDYSPKFEKNNTKPVLSSISFAKSEKSPEKLSKSSPEPRSDLVEQPEITGRFQIPLETIDFSKKIEENNQRHICSPILAVKLEESIEKLSRSSPENITTLSKHLETNKLSSPPTINVIFLQRNERNETKHVLSPIFDSKIAESSKKSPKESPVSLPDAAEHLDTPTNINCGQNLPESGGNQTDCIMSSILESKLGTSTRKSRPGIPYELEKHEELARRLSTTPHYQNSRNSTICSKETALQEASRELEEKLRDLEANDPDRRIPGIYDDDENTSESAKTIETVCLLKNLLKEAAELNNSPEFRGFPDDDYVSKEHEGIAYYRSLKRAKEQNDDHDVKPRKRRAIKNDSWADSFENYPVFGPYKCNQRTIQSQDLRNDKEGRITLPGKPEDAPTCSDDKC